MGSGEGFGQGRQATAVALRSLSVALGCGTGATGAGLAVPVLRWHASRARSHGSDHDVSGPGRPGARLGSICGVGHQLEEGALDRALGHEWSAAIGDRVRGNECPTCKRRVVLAGFNDLATTHPELATQADGWDPTTVSKGHITKLA